MSLLRIASIACAPTDTYFLLKCIHAHTCILILDTLQNTEHQIMNVQIDERASALVLFYYDRYYIIYDLVDFMQNKNILALYIITNIVKFGKLIQL